MSGLIGKTLNRLLGRDAAQPARLAERPGLSYEQIKELARHKDPSVRGSLAARQDVGPEVLYYLAEDPSPEVRRRIAANPATPAQADLKLAADANPDVRGDLAGKIARLAPGLSPDEQDRLRQSTYEALALLARDQITRVRQILAETLRDVANAPPDLILTLAHDPALEVALPILEFSPVLTDEDLLEIIQSAPVTDRLSAISRRALVAPDVADAIVHSEDVTAVAVLLGNPSAQIREETLDMLLDHAPQHELWHAPLVNRPQLSARAATRLARFVAESLLQRLQERPDIDPETKAAVAAVVRRRVEENGSDMAEFHRGAGRGGEAESRFAAEDPFEVAQRLHQEGKLDETALISGIASGKHAFVVAALAVRADLPLELAQKVVATRSAKGMLALCWKAGLKAPTAVLAQIRLSKIAPGDILRPLPDSQDYPMTAEEMAWQLDFFTTMAAVGKAAGMH